MDFPNSPYENKLNSRGLHPSALPLCLLILALCASLGQAGCASVGSSGSSTGKGTAPAITSFLATPASVNSGTSSTLSWAATGATSIKITPGTFTANSPSGSTSVSPTATTTYTLTATNATGSSTSAATVTVTATQPSKPTISSFTATPASINSGSSSTLMWATSGAATIAITPGTFTSTLASGSTSVSPTTTTTYTLTATNNAGSTTSTAKVTVTSSGGPLAITTTSCPGGTQGAAYAGCTIAASGGAPPYTFSASANPNFPSLPEGMSLDPATGIISSALIGAEGSYTPEFVVKDSTNAQATQDISFAINGSNAFLANIFPSTSIFHHRVDAATTRLPVDSSPAAPMYSGYLAATVKPFFGNNSNGAFPNGIPAIQVPFNQANVSVSTTLYQSYFTSGPIPAYAPVEGTSQSTGDRHVLVYLQAGGGNKPALYEMWQGIYQGGPWTDSSNALWPDVTSNALTAQGNGTSDAAGLPVAPLLANADEVIGTGTPTAPNGTVRHPIRFTLNHIVNYWVWPATQTAGVGSCTASGGGTIPTESQISQSAPPASCTMSGPAGEIYRLKASVATPSCATTSPQAAILITAFRNYGIILADNGDSGGLIGTPDARWNDNDLSCITSLTLGDFEPVNVSSLIVNNNSGATSH
ncbi:MAG TPA: putative Ig domain-containing protein [Candidatus Acidoferrum sp.]|nr:putative Ig domain-containing protein [Candidatus Acidoferrum sp.]